MRRIRMSPGGILLCLVLDFHFFVVFSVLYKCWGTLLVCVLGLLFIFKGEAIFFVAKLSSNSSSSGDGYQDTLKVCILNFMLKI